MGNSAAPGKAVIDGQIQYTSVTALNRFIDCPRSWYFRYVLGLPDPVGKAAQIGIEGHERIAYYLTGGAKEDVLGPMERAGAEYIPAPGPGLHVEQRVDGGLDLGGIPMLGGLDLLDRRSSPWTVTDWKFKSDLKYGYTAPEWLRSAEHSDGRQMLAYGEWVRRTFEARGSVWLRHVHFQTRGAKLADETRVEVPFDEIQEKWNTLGDTYAGRLENAAKAATPEDLEPNRGHCHKYRKPCVYINRCPGGAITVNELFAFGAKAEETSVGLLDRMKELNASPKALVIDESTVPDEVLKARQAVQISGREPNGATVKDGPGWVETQCEAGHPVGKRPPPGYTVSSAACDTCRAAPQGVAAPTGEAPKAKRGRPKSVATVETPVETPMTIPSRIVLYFGCSPVGVGTANFAAYAAEVQKAVLVKLKDSAFDVRLSEHDGLKFGKWKAVLAKYAVENPPAPGHYIIPAGDELAEAAAVGLAAVAGPGDVVRGGGR